jgi:hypothetical protein
MGNGVNVRLFCFNNISGRREKVFFWYVKRTIFPYQGLIMSTSSTTVEDVESYAES